MQMTVRVMKRAICLIVISLTLITTIPLSWFLNKLEIDSEVDQDFDDMIISIKSQQKSKNQLEEMKQKEANSKIHSKYSWILQNNALTNYFQQKESLKGLYRNSNIVFLHNPRAAGSSIIHCIENLTHGTQLNFSPLMNSNKRYEWETRLMYRTSKFRSGLKIHRGKFSFGLCNGLNDECSYFILVRDPLERALSSYKYCKTYTNDELCLVADANNMSAKQWIIHQGSLLLQQLTFNSDSCNLTPDIDYGTEPESLRTEEMPCWYKHKLFLKNLNQHDYSLLLNYVVNNVDKWFGVIGLYEDIHTSLKMFQHVYQIPLTECPFLQDQNKDINSIKNNKANRRKRKDDESEEENDDYSYLLYDSEIREALKADIRIYNSLKSMYAIQKQIHFNSLKLL